MYPALASNSGTLQANDDGSYDLYFGPKAPAGKDTNWVETIPGKSWFQLFGSTVRCNRGLIRRGSSTSSNPSTEHPDTSITATRAFPVQRNPRNTAGRSPLGRRRSRFCFECSSARRGQVTPPACVAPG